MPADPKKIPDECFLLRRITPNQVVPDKNLGNGRRRLSSGAFRDRNLSTDAECLLHEARHDWTFTLKQYPNFYLVRFSAGLARNHRQAVEHKPLENNEFHAEVIGSKSNPVCNALRDAAEWVKKPDDVD
jgi:hypothetical protein